MNQNLCNQITTPSENNGTEEVDEQELQGISDGCISCGIVATAAAKLASNAATKALRTGSIKDYAKNYDYMNVFAKTAPHVSTETRPCENCIGGAKDLFQAIIKH